MATVITLAQSTTVGNYSAVQSLASLDASIDLVFALDKTATSSDVVEVYGSGDSTVTSSTGCQQLCRLVGGNGATQIQTLSAPWPPYLIMKRAGGTSALNCTITGQANMSTSIITSDVATVQGGLGVDITATTGAVNIAATAGAVNVTPGTSFGVQAGTNVGLIHAAAGFVQVAATGGANSGHLRLYDADQSAYAGLRAAAVTTSYTLDLPAAAPTANAQTLSVTTAGVVTFVSPRAGSFAAAASLTNAAAQYVPPGSGAASSLTASGLGVLIESDRTISEIRIQFTGDAANVAGQTITTTVYKNGVSVGTAISGTATTAGTKSGSSTFAAVSFVAGDVLTVSITPSAGLTNVLTNVMIVVK